MAAQQLDENSILELTKRESWDESEYETLYQVFIRYAKSPRGASFAFLNLGLYILIQNELGIVNADELYYNMCNEILDDKIQDPNGTVIAILIGKLLGKEEEVLMLQDKAAGLLSTAEDRDLSGS